MFGPNNIYRCNCEQLVSCDFSDNGRCKPTGCSSGYGGPFCQKRLYGQYSSHTVSPDLNVFAKSWTKVKKINFQLVSKETYSINQIQMIYSPAWKGTSQISVYIGQTLFCEKTFTEGGTLNCPGDLSGKTVSIEATPDIYVRKVEMAGCSPFWFGEDCDKQCHCAENSDCHKMSGNCPQGCESGRSGPDCQTLNYENIALNKLATQSSIYTKDTVLDNGTCKERPVSFPASLAVDGNTDQKHERRSCMHTEGKDQNSWWRVDLGKIYSIYQIRIYNRDFENSDELKDYSVVVGGQLCRYLSEDIVKASKIIDVFCPQVLQGSFVEIKRYSYWTSNRRALHICEVEILQCLKGFYGKNCGNSCPKCQNSACEPQTGKCVSGCEVGYEQLPNKPCTECSQGFYGKNCGNSCPECKNAACEKQNGKCVSGCALGYEQLLPTKPCTECSQGSYGINCGNSCPKCKNSACEPQNGKCVSGCALGYEQLLNKPCTECSHGSYGKDCGNSCPKCKNSACEKQYGKCSSGCASGYELLPNKTCTVQVVKKDEETGRADTIWDETQSVPDKKTEGCDSNMRRFGTDDLYQCHCQDLASCHFGNKGKCTTNTKCTSGYGGPFCQKIRYHKYLLTDLTATQNVFSDSKEIQTQLDIPFKYKYRIHLIEMKCKSTAATISLFIDSVLFCETECQQITRCEGDASGKTLSIKTTNGISLSKLKVFGCSPFWFGEDCDKQCHCAENSDCHKMSGNCPQGCELGRSGPGCQTLNYDNVALNKLASQSTTYGSSIILDNGTCRHKNFKFAAHLAVDGNTDQKMERLSCMHTQSGRPHTWKVDLGEEYNISQIRIYNRETLLWRLTGARIEVGDKLCHQITSKKKIYDIKCDPAIRGRIIKITDNWYNFLTFCEVEVLQCLHSFYGDRCSKSCPQCKDSSCDPLNGVCVSGCRPGYKQHGTEACTACSSGTFGQGCSQECRCKNIIDCDKAIGTCRYGGCEAGFKGSNCQEPCSVGMFGGGCSQTCHCENNNNCNEKDGTCGRGSCEAGYKGFNCQDPCSIGTFGQGCSQECHCKNFIDCDKAIGTCGYGGCEAGFKGSNCQKPCSVGMFGGGCSQTCHCENNKNCNKTNGTCGLGSCEAGYKGFNCQDRNIKIPLIIGLSVSLIILLIIAGIVIGFKVRKSKKKEPSTSLIRPELSLQENNIEMDSVADADDENDTEPMDEPENIYMNRESLQQTTMNITKDNIFSYVKNKKMEELPFTEEFLTLPKGLLYAHNTAKEEKNRSKNRYKTILPYDHSRVCLFPDEQSSSDYINANYITENKTFIATQGPLSSTINDFWRMIYQRRCSIIVMLTNLSENGKLKCQQYWPDVETTKTYGMITVTNKIENTYSYYTYREFYITKNSEDLWVDHYQFTSWPDHGAPKVPEYFIAFRNKVRSIPLYKPPILVHCSAGVGRSGTYIVLDIILEEMKTNPNIDVIDCILKLRKDRLLIVQNRSQLEFIYDVLLENVITGHTVNYVQELPEVYNELQLIPANGRTSFMKQQFEELILPFNMAASNSPNDRGASMSYDNERYVDDDENQAIVGAILSGNNLEEEFILMSTPSEEEEELADFWNAVFVKRCTLLVMFDNMTSEEAVYWPQKKNSAVEYNHFAVTLIDEQHNNLYIKRTMKVYSSKLNMPELRVHQFQFKIWLGTDFPSPIEIVEIIQTVKNCQLNQKRKLITLHCLDGISKNGLFCVLYMIIEILKKDSMISIVQLIRLLRRTNKDIIPDYVSYHYCWLVAKIYLEDLSVYSNA